jgi:photosystem II stability/assembly factor-like uncharacterized protein
MRLLTFFSSLLGFAVFVSAVFLWSPARILERQVNPVDEATRGVFFAIAKNRDRIVAVGEHGRILHSADNGKTWETAAPTPVDVSLTAITFLNEKLGWVVGYDGVILKTTDGGMSWIIVREPSVNALPLFAVWFKDENIGLAVGADSTVYRSVDGGAHWNLTKIEAQSHLYDIVQTPDGLVWITGDNNALLLSADLGIHWQQITPPFISSFFGAIALNDHQLMTFGLRGRVSIWNMSALVDTKKEADETLSTGIRLADGRIVLAGQRGRVLVGQAQSFRTLKISPAKDIGSVVEVPDALIFTGEFGILRVAKSEMNL